MKYIFEHWLMVWFLFLFIIELVVYNFSAIKYSSYRYHWYSNVINYSVTKLVSIIAMAPLIEYASEHSIVSVLDGNGVFVSVFFSLIILDLTGYLFHFASHKIEFLWRFHEVHHMDEVLDVSTSLRVYFIEYFFHMVLNCIVIFCFGIGKEAIAVYFLMSFIFAAYHHSKFAMPVPIEKIISYFVTTPRYHAPHHDRDIKNNQTNYSFIFPVWDRLFRTYNKNTVVNIWDFGLSYINNVSPIESLIRPLRGKK